MTTISNKDILQSQRNRNKHKAKGFLATKPAFQKILKESDTQKRKQDNYNQRTWEGMNLPRRVDEQTRTRKEPNTIDLVSHKIPKMNKGARNESHVDYMKQLEDNPQNDRTQCILFNNDQRQMISILQLNEADWLTGL